MSYNKNIFDVADYFLWKTYEERGAISPLKLQKLCFYAQAWHLALTRGKELFSEDFEAWVHGPVNYALYNKYKYYGGRSISQESNFKIQCEKFSPAELSFLNEVWERYGHFEAKVLENLTHQEGPWIDARNGLSDYENSNNIIPKSSMTDYYRSIIVG